MTIDVDASNFQTEVLERSRQTPVVVDFWASWCGPCRMLGPVLEAAVEARDGEVVLAKLDTDANPELAQRYQIRGIPAVKAFRDGAVVSEFVGAQPRAAVDRFLDGLAPSETDRLVSAGDEASLRRAADLSPDRADAVLPLARLLHARGEDDEALSRLRKVPGFAAEGLAAQIELERAHVAELEPAWKELGAGREGQALDLLLAALPGAGERRDQLRRVVIGLLDRMQPSEAGRYRRKLASALY
ncbi:MAG: thioredoxin [Candidatus Dormibacteraeota bacterium]|nr:thioredoxin [Candidatus Dormibacteraeota bacterium]